jgi:glycosyltransferase involved in cell wall biosynthesis
MSKAIKPSVLRIASDSVQGSSQGAMYPLVSVIVPVSRSEQALQTLESLSFQGYAGEIEIIIVGSIADELAHHWLAIPVITATIYEPAKARNLGVAHANGDLLLFLDDDCTVAEDWVERNVQALQQPRIGAIGARIRGKSHSFFARCTDFTNFGAYQHGRSTEGPVASASMGVHREVFHALGGFDQTMRSGEDMDFCYRLQKQGYRTLYLPDIIVTHDHRRDSLSKLLRNNYAHGLAGGLKTKIQHRDMGLKNRLLFNVRFPPLFLLLLPFIAAMATARIVVANAGENWNVLLYIPFIFLGKLAYEFGIFRQLKLPGIGRSTREERCG